MTKLERKSFLELYVNITLDLYCYICQMYLTINIILFNLNVYVLDTFVQRIMILTVHKLRLDSPADSRTKQFVPRVDSERARREGAVHRSLRCSERERTRAGQEGAEQINALLAALQFFAMLNCQIKTS